MGRRARLMDKERGFTLIELLTVMMIVGALVLLAVPALRNFWFVRALESGRQEVQSQLRRQQQRVVAETHPLVYGLRFPNRDSGQTPLDQVGIVRFNGRDPSTTDDDLCGLENVVDLPTGVEVGQVRTTMGDPYVTDFCKNQIRDELDLPSNDHFVFFFARGNANAAQIELVQVRLEDRPAYLCVSPVTARVFEIESPPCAYT
ncbi:MAG: prepilin-type N-terminal cleavage/methylation domain-containing protein [Actinomycetota bacterium]